jgi:hypothetical protein
MHLEAARIERPAEPPHHAALARGVPAFHNDHGTMRGAQIGLLHELQGLLHRRQPALIVGELDDRKALDRREARRPADDEVGRSHPAAATLHRQAAARRSVRCQRTIRSRCN